MTGQPKPYTVYDALQAENALLEAWVADLQSGMYVNCVYCGHRYGPKETTPVSMADALKAHVEQCPKHPMSKLKEENEWLRGFFNKAMPIIRKCASEEGTTVDDHDAAAIIDQLPRDVWVKVQEEHR